MARIEFELNGERRTVDLAADMPLLWALRDHLDLPGTRFSCGQGICGSCTVLLDDEAVRSCVVPLSDVAGGKVTTIEGLSADGSHRVQRAWIAEQVPQCGYCQPGQIMAAVALLRREPEPDDATIHTAMNDVLGRSGTYERMQRAIHRAAKEA